MRKFSLLLSCCFLLSTWMMMMISFDSAQNLPEVQPQDVDQQDIIDVNSSAMKYKFSVYNQSDTTPIRILSWTPLFPWKSKWYTEGSAAFEKCGLGAHMQCTYTSNRSNLLESDAILFKMRQIKDVSFLPSHRLPHQKWIFYENESPSETWSYLPKLNSIDLQDVFNITSTYAQDSDVPTRLPTKCMLSIHKYNRLKSYNLAANKSKGVAWFVSHCITPSQRELYVRELSKYIPVDTYGSCGSLKCGTFSKRESISPEEIERCDRVHLNGSYRFYLSFENSLCEDYVTEKLTRLLNPRVNVIPIVLGLQNYSRLMPHGTYIDVQDFKSPEQLAIHLRNIENDDEAYNAYVRLKMALDCQSSELTHPYECRLCEYLYIHRKQKQFVNVKDYWSVKKKCMPPESFYKGIADHLLQTQ